MLAALLGPPPDSRYARRGLAHQPGQLSDETDMVAAAALQQRRSGPRDVGLFEHPQHSGRTFGLDRLGHLVGRRRPVGQHVVDLVDDRDAVVGQPLGDVHLPQRSIAIQRRAGDLTDQLVQLAASTGRGHPDLADVVVEVDVVVDHPHRVMQLQRDVDELIAKRRHRLQSRIRDLAEHIEAVSADLRHIEDADLERVHVDFGRLGVQHQRVHAVESFHTHPIRRQPRRRVPAIALLLPPRQRLRGKFHPRA